MQECFDQYLVFCFLWHWDLFSRFLAIFVNVSFGYVQSILKMSGNVLFNPIPSHSQWFISIPFPMPGLA